MLEYCAGGAVDNIMIELDKALSESQIASITRQVVNGLIFLHSKYVIHRDLKAGNILLTADGVAKIGKFGSLKTVYEVSILLHIFQPILAFPPF